MFKAWFENQENTNPFPNSTVPYLVYHGTNKRPFKQFEYQKSQTRMNPVHLVLYAKSPLADKIPA